MESHRHGDFRHGGGSDGARALGCSRASPGAPACGKHGCHDRPEGWPRPCGVPRRDGCLQVGLDGGFVRDRGFGPRRFANSAVACCRDFDVERGTGFAVGQTRAGRGGGTHRRDLRRPGNPKPSKGPTSPSGLQFHLHDQLPEWPLLAMTDRTSCVNIWRGIESPSHGGAFTVHRWPSPERACRLRETLGAPNWIPSQARPRLPQDQQLFSKCHVPVLLGR